VIDAVVTLAASRAALLATWAVGLGFFYSIRRDRRTLKSPYKGIAYAVAAALAALGTAMLYVSLVWLDKPV
jgi:hypothetical protein